MLTAVDLVCARAHPPLSKPPVCSALDGLADKRWPEPLPYPSPVCSLTTEHRHGR